MLSIKHKRTPEYKQQNYKTERQLYDNVMNGPTNHNPNQQVRNTIYAQKVTCHQLACLLLPAAVESYVELLELVEGNLVWHSRTNQSRSDKLTVLHPAIAHNYNIHSSHINTNPTASSLLYVSFFIKTHLHSIVFNNKL